MTKVWFVRHGESISNANLPTETPEGSELTPKGEHEAKLAATFFTKAPDLIVTSSYTRAQQTAVPTINRFPTVPVETWPVHEFTYLAPIRYKGTIGDERWEVAKAYWQRCDPLEKELGEGESFAELLARVDVLVAQLRRHSADTIILFSHGLFLRALLWSVLAEYQEPTPRLMRRYSNFTQALSIPNCAIFEGHFVEKRPILFGSFQLAHLG